MSRLIVLAAGGTGGHLFPAQALAEALIKRGHRIHLMTDERVRDYGKNFPAEKTHIIESASPSLKKPFSFLKLFHGYRLAKNIMKRERPSVVVGFGGYPSFPPIYAATSLRLPTLVHEANSVLGRANKLLAGKVDVVAGSFVETIGLPAAAKLVVTGNPVRAVVLAHKGAPYPLLNGAFNVLVFGGSQGAKFFADFMPGVFRAMPETLRSSIRLTQQCRPEDMDRVKAEYAAANVAADLQPFFMDLPKRIANAHLVIGRSGASTIAELGVIGRPAALVPLPHALDNDQLRNAQSFSAAGAGWVCHQAELNSADFAQFLQRLLADGAGLKRAADSALSHGRPDAAERLADLVEKIMTPEMLPL